LFYNNRSNMKTYGEPGGVYLTYALNLDRGAYVVENEAGDELYASGSEADAQRFCEDLIQREAAALMYQSQAARDAQRGGYGGPAYWQYLDDHACKMRDYWRARGDEEQAALMLTRSLGQALAGNDGE
jgi:hypothetical protein